MPAPISNSFHLPVIFKLIFYGQKNKYLCVTVRFYTYSDIFFLVYVQNNRFWENIYIVLKDAIAPLWVGTPIYIYLVYYQRISDNVRFSTREITRMKGTRSIKLLEVFRYREFTPWCIVVVGDGVIRIGMGWDDAHEREDGGDFFCMIEELYGILEYKKSCIVSNVSTMRIYYRNGTPTFRASPPG